MSVAEYLLIAFSLNVPTMVTIRSCALKNHIRLTRGLGVSLLIAIEHALLLIVGLFVSSLLRFDISDYDNLISLGLMVVVAGRMFFAAFSKKEKPSYDISRWDTVSLLGLATGANALFVGLGLGFLVNFSSDLWKVSVPMLVVTFLASYFAIMLGRRQKEFRSRRWLLLGVLFLLVLAIKGAFFSH